MHVCISDLNSVKMNTTANPFHCRLFFSFLLAFEIELLFRPCAACHNDDELEVLVKLLYMLRLIEQLARVDSEGGVVRARQ
jgi:hypothetical protein